MMFRRLAHQTWLLLLMMLAGTAIDWAVHHLRDAWAVPPEYFPSKIIFGTLWSVISAWLMIRILRETRTGALALGVPAIVALFLQTKYFYQGYPLDFVLLFMGLHYVMFLPGSFWVFSRHRYVFLDDAGASPRRRWPLFIGAVLALEALFAAYFLSLYGWLR
jgi:hypothetical protein